MLQRTQGVTLYEPPRSEPQRKAFFNPACAPPPLGPAATRHGDASTHHGALQQQQQQQQPYAPYSSGGGNSGGGGGGPVVDTPGTPDASEHGGGARRGSLWAPELPPSRTLALPSLAAQQRWASAASAPRHGGQTAASAVDRFAADLYEHAEFDAAADGGGAPPLWRWSIGAGGTGYGADKAVGGTGGQYIIPHGAELGRPVDAGASGALAAAPGKPPAPPPRPSMGAYPGMAVGLAEMEQANRLHQLRLQDPQRPQHPQQLAAPWLGAEGVAGSTPPLSPELQHQHQHHQPYFNPRHHPALGNVPVAYAPRGGGDPELSALYAAFPDPLSNWEHFTGYRAWVAQYKDSLAVWERRVEWDKAWYKHQVTRLLVHAAFVQAVDPAAGAAFRDAASAA
eukprot:56194-Chlamydomonas_euryale.AAC.8